MIVYAPQMAKTVSVRELRANLSGYLDQASRHEQVVVTRNGKPAAVIISVDEYAGLEETAEILSDPGTVAAIEQGLAEIGRGETVSLDELRRELAERRATG